MGESTTSKRTSEKLLAEWFWIDRWDGSPAAGLPLLARGLYREMLTRAWRLGGWLPSDPETIQRLVRVTPAEWRKAWPLVSSYWRQEGDRLVNDTQLEVMEEARRRREAASEHGRKGAMGKHGVKPEQCPSSARAVPGDQPPSPSPRTNGKQTIGARAPGSAKETWLTPYCEAWRERWGVESEPPVGEMLKPLAKARETLGDHEALARWRRFLAAAERALWARPTRFAEGLGEWAEGGSAPVLYEQSYRDKQIAKEQAQRAAAKGPVPLELPIARIP